MINFFLSLHLKNCHNFKGAINSEHLLQVARRVIVLYNEQILKKIIFVHRSQQKFIIFAHK